MKNLLLAEKPDQARKYIPLLEGEENQSFEKHDGYFESNNWIITYCIGHLLQFDSPVNLGLTRDVNLIPFVPDKFTLIPDPKKSKQVKTVARLLKEVVKSSGLIVNGTDAGREGELIFGRMLEYIDYPINSDNVERLWLNSFQMKDMVKAWNNRIEYSEHYPSYQASVARSYADWIVGINASMGYQIATNSRNISVGRVQTPTLNLIVERDQLVENAKDVFYYVYAVECEQRMFHVYKDEEYKFSSEKEVNAFISKLGDGRLLINEAEKKKSSKKAPKPFYLGSLQKEANQKFGYSLDETLKIAQTLYEAQMISYPRTDCEFLPESMFEEAYELAMTFANEEYAVSGKLKAKSEKFSQFNDAKLSDHYAITPLVVGNSKFDKLSEKEKKVYDLIIRQFIASFCIDYEIETVHYIGEIKEYEFKNSSKTIIEKGFKSVLLSNKEEEDLSVLEVGKSYDYQDKGVEEKKEKKPSYFTFATLLSAMENAGKKVDDEELASLMRKEGKGLGTPATQSSIVEVLAKREFIETRGKKIVSTDKGRKLISIIRAELKSAELTAGWESKLKQIEKGEVSYDEYMSDIVAFMDEVKSDFHKNIDVDLGGESEITCPVCKKGKVITGKKAYGCSEWKEGCEFRVWKSVGGKSVTRAMLEALISKGETKLIKGFKNKEGKSFDAQLQFVDGKLSYKFTDNTTKITCPICKKGVLVEREKFYGCKEWKEGCEFKIWKNISGKKLTEKVISDIVTKGKSEKLSGFKSNKTQKKFSARIVLKEDGKFTFDFN